jgi:hypothetical protein
MGNVHTLDSLKNGSTSIINEESVNNGTQLVSVLRLRAKESEIRVAEIALVKRRAEEFRRYTEENVSSSPFGSEGESLPDLYPAPDEIEPGANNITLFDLIKKIYNRLINSDIQVNDSNIDSLITFFKKEEESENLSEEVKTVLENITLNESLPSFGMRPLGKFGDITLNQLVDIIQNFNFSMVLDNTELLVYPISLLPFSLIYYKLVRSYMRHCDSIDDIRRIKNERLRMHQLRIRRVSIAATVGLIIPLSTLMILKFSMVD